MSTRKVEPSMPNQRMSESSHLRLIEGDGAGVLTGRFRRARELDERSDHARRVMRAVNRAKQGDNEALRFLYVSYADNVYGYVLSIVRDEHEAEDVTQHVFAKLITSISKYEARATPFSAWMLRVARNAAIDHVRHNRTVPTEEVWASTEPDLHDSGDRLRGLADALAALPEEQRTVLVLRQLLGLSPAEVAERLGRTESSIHGLHHRARRVLRGELIEMGLAPATAGP
jgi:RNA polymerase sigma-70 factor, ECF subfamily